jgi:hypothetical protein
MADYGVAVTWGDPRAGREKKALELWLDTVTLNEKAVADGRIERWDAVIFEPTGSPPAGALRIYGTQQQVEEFVRSDDFSEQVLRAELLLSNVALRRFATGDLLATQFAKYAQLVESL